MQEIDIASTNYQSNHVTGPNNLHHSIEIGGDGNYYINGGDGLWVWPGGSSATKVDGATGWGLPTIYIPPAEEPDIQEVQAYCNDKDSIIDLNTYWVCNGLSAEDTVGGKAPAEQRHRYWIFGHHR